MRRRGDFEASPVESLAVRSRSGSAGLSTLRPAHRGVLAGDGVTSRSEGGRSSAELAEASLAVQRVAGNSAMVQLLRKGGEQGARPPRSAGGAVARPVQRMPGSGHTTTFGPGGPLDGLDGDGNYYKFDHQHVYAVPASDAHGHVIGIGFPTNPGDEEHFARWTRQPNRIADREVWNVKLSSDELPLVYYREPAPWAGRPLYVHVHSSNEFFAIQVQVDQNTRKVIKVDGAVFGRILRRQPAYRAAARNTPGQDGVLTACLAGHPQATAARDMAQYMHGEGSNRTWHTSLGYGVRRSRESEGWSIFGSSQWWDEYGIERPGGLVSYRPPQRQQGQMPGQQAPSSSGSAHTSYPYQGGPSYPYQP